MRNGKGWLTRLWTQQLNCPDLRRARPLHRTDISTFKAMLEQVPAEALDEPARFQMSAQPVNVVGWQ
jgi:hypothetical protein